MSLINHDLDLYHVLQKEEFSSRKVVRQLIAERAIEREGMVMNEDFKENEPSIDEGEVDRDLILLTNVCY